MLFEILDPVRLDNRVICDSFRLALYPEDSQLRCKIAFPQTVTSEATLVDLVVYNYTLPRIDGLGASVSFRGTEMVTGVNFDAKIQLEVLKRRCKFRGNLGTNHFSFECESVLEVIERIGQLIQSVTPNQGITVVPKY